MKINHRILVLSTIVLLLCQQVILSATFSLTAKCLTSGIELSWDRLSSAPGGYNIYMKLASESSYPSMSLTDFPITDTKYIVTKNIIVGNSYCFIVKPLDNTFKEIVGLVSNEICVLYKPPQEETLTVIFQVGKSIAIVNNKQIKMDAPPEITKSRMFVPLRILGEALGAKVEYEANQKKITIIYTSASQNNAQTVQIWINKPNGLINGISKQIDPYDNTVTPYINNSRTMVPMRFIGEALLAKEILWDGNLKKVTFIFLKSSSENSKPDNPPISGEEKTIIVSGSVSEQNKKFIYSIQAPVTGKYLVEVYDRTANNNVTLYVYDSLQRELGSCSWQNKLNVDLVMNETYTIHILKSYNDLDFKLKIEIPNDVRDISGQTLIEDEIRYEGQINQYLFHAFVTGRYLIEVIDRTADNRVVLYIHDSLKREIGSVSWQNQLNVDLIRGETYKISLYYANDPLVYKLRINIPNEIRDISGQTLIEDEIRYEGQINQYIYTAQKTGKYQIDIIDRTGNNNVIFYIYDSLDRELGSTSWGNKLTVDFVQGQTYKMKIIEANSLLYYKIMITLPT